MGIMSKPLRRNNREEEEVDNELIHQTNGYARLIEPASNTRISHSPSAIVINQPTVQTNNNFAFPTRPARNLTWTAGLFSCCNDLNECFCAYFCTCCYICGLFSQSNESCFSECFGGLVPLRTKIRTERGIDGSICKDFFAVYCCPFCAVVQMGIELKSTRSLI